MIPAVCCLLMAAPLSAVDAFSMVAPQSSSSSLARSPYPAWKSPLRHPNELTDELNDIRRQKQDAEQKTLNKNKQQRHGKKPKQQKAEVTAAPIPKKTAHANALFVADPTRASVLRQPIFEEVVAKHQKQQQVKSAILRNVAEFVVTEFDNQQLSKGRALLLSQAETETHSRTIGDVVFAQESMEHLWRVAGEAVVDFGLYDDASTVGTLPSLDLGLDGAFQVDE